jgi:hypothetical protein
MSRLRTRPEKRDAELKRDHRTAMEAPHAFRKNWPRKKARINRNRRRTADAAVQAVLRGADAEAVVVPRRLRGEHLHKMGVSPLADVVAGKSQSVRADFLPRYIAPRRDPAEHADRFRGFLAALVQGRTQVAADRAKYLLWLLDMELPNHHALLYKQIWLRRFFAAEPHWETRVRRWCQQVQARCSADTCNG